MPLCCAEVEQTTQAGPDHICPGGGRGAGGGLWNTDSPHLGPVCPLWYSLLLNEPCVLRKRCGSGGQGSHPEVRWAVRFCGQEASTPQLNKQNGLGGYHCPGQKVISG